MLPVLTRAARRAFARWIVGLLNLPVHQWGADLPRPAASEAGGMYVSILRMSGPTPRGTWTRDRQAEVPASATITLLPAVALAGGYVRVVVDGRDFSFLAPAPTTVEAARDALLADMQAEMDVRATFSGQGVDAILVTPDQPGAVTNVTVLGDVSLVTPTVEVTVDFGLAESRLRLTVHSPAGEAATTSAGPDGLAAQMLADLKGTAAKALLKRWGIVCDGRGRDLQVTNVKDGGGSEVRAFFDVFYTEPGWVARPADAVSEVDLAGVGGLSQPGDNTPGAAQLEGFDLISGNP